MSDIIMSLASKCMQSTTQRSSPDIYELSEDWLQAKAQCYEELSQYSLVNAQASFSCHGSLDAPPSLSYSSNIAQLSYCAHFLLALSCRELVDASNPIQSRIEKSSQSLLNAIHACKAFPNYAESIVDELATLHDMALESDISHSLPAISPDFSAVHPHDDTQYGSFPTTDVNVPFSLPDDSFLVLSSDTLNLSTIHTLHPAHDTHTNNSLAPPDPNTSYFGSSLRWPGETRPIPVACDKEHEDNTKSTMDVEPGVNADTISGNESATAADTVCGPALTGNRGSRLPGGASDASASHRNERVTSAKANTSAGMGAAGDSAKGTGTCVQGNRGYSAAMLGGRVRSVGEHRSRGYSARERVSYIHGTSAAVRAHNVQDASQPGNRARWDNSARRKHPTQSTGVLKDRPQTHAGIEPSDGVAGMVSLASGTAGEPTDIGADMGTVKSSIAHADTGVGVDGMGACFDNMSLDGYDIIFSHSHTSSSATAAPSHVSVHSGTSPLHATDTRTDTHVRNGTHISAPTSANTNDAYNSSLTTDTTTPTPVLGDSSCPPTHSSLPSRLNTRAALSALVYDICLFLNSLPLAYSSNPGIIVTDTDNYHNATTAPKAVSEGCITSLAEILAHVPAWYRALYQQTCLPALSEPLSTHSNPPQHTANAMNAADDEHAALSVDIADILSAVRARDVTEDTTVGVMLSPYFLPFFTHATNTDSKQQSSPCHFPLPPSSSPSSLSSFGSPSFSSMATSTSIATNHDDLLSHLDTDIHAALTQIKDIIRTPSDSKRQDLSFSGSFSGISTDFSDGLSRNDTHTGLCPCCRLYVPAPIELYTALSVFWMRFHTFTILTALASASSPSHCPSSSPVCPSSFSPVLTSPNDSLSTSSLPSPAPPPPSSPLSWRILPFFTSTAVGESSLLRVARCVTIMVTSLHTDMEIIGMEDARTYATSNTTTAGADTNVSTPANASTLASTAASTYDASHNASDTCFTASVEGISINTMAVDRASAGVPIKTGLGATNTGTATTASTASSSSHSQQCGHTSQDICNPASHLFHKHHSHASRSCEACCHASSTSASRSCTSPRFAEYSHATRRLATYSHTLAVLLAALHRGAIIHAEEATRQKHQFYSCSLETARNTAVLIDNCRDTTMSMPLLCYYLLLSSSTFSTTERLSSHIPFSSLTGIASFLNSTATLHQAAPQAHSSSSLTLPTFPHSAHGPLLGVISPHSIAEVSWHAFFTSSSPHSATNTTTAHKTNTHITANTLHGNINTLTATAAIATCNVDLSALAAASTPALAAMRNALSPYSHVNPLCAVFRDRHGREGDVLAATLTLRGVLQTLWLAHCSGDGDGSSRGRDGGDATGSMTGATARDSADLGACSGRRELDAGRDGSETVRLWQDALLLTDSTASCFYSLAQRLHDMHAFTNLTSSDTQLTQLVERARQWREQQEWHRQSRVFSTVTRAVGQLCSRAIRIESDVQHRAMLCGEDAVAAKVRMQRVVMSWRRAMAEDVGKYQATVRTLHHRCGEAERALSTTLHELLARNGEARKQALKAKEQARLVAQLRGEKAVAEEVARVERLEKEEKEQEIEQLRGECAALREAGLAKDTRLDAYVAERDQLRQMLAASQAEVDAQQQTITQLQQRTEETAALLEEERAQHAATAREKEDWRERWQAEEERYQRAMTTMSGMGEHILQLQSEVAVVAQEKEDMVVAHTSAKDMLVRERNALYRQKEQLTDQLRLVNDDLDVAEQRQRQVEKDNIALKASLAAREAELEELRTALLERENKIQACVKEGEVATQAHAVELAKLQAKVQSASTALASLQQNMDAKLDSQAQEHERVLADMGRQREEEARSHHVTVAQLKKKAVEAHREREDVLARFAVLEKRNIDLQATITKLEEEKTHSTATIRRLTSENRKSGRKLLDMEELHEQTEVRIRELAVQVKERDRRVGELQKRLQASEGTVAELRLKMDRYKGVVAAFQSLANDADADG